MTQVKLLDLKEHMGLGKTCLTSCPLFLASVCQIYTEIHQKMTLTVVARLDYLPKKSEKIKQLVSTPTANERSSCY